MRYCFISDGEELGAYRMICDRQVLSDTAEQRTLRSGRLSKMWNNLLQKLHKFKCNVKQEE